MFIQANAYPSRALAYIGFLAVLFFTEYSIDPIFSVTINRGGYFVLITSGRSSDSCSSIKGEVTVFASRLVTSPPSGLSRSSTVDIIHPGSA